MHGHPLGSLLDHLHPDIRKTVHRSQERQKQGHDVRAKAREFNVDDLVYSRNYGQGPACMVTGKSDREKGISHIDQLRSRGWQGMWWTSLQSEILQIKQQEITWTYLNHSAQKERRWKVWQHQETQRSPNSPQAHQNPQKQVRTTGGSELTPELTSELTIELTPELPTVDTPAETGQRQSSSRSVNRPEYYGNQRFY